MTAKAAGKATGTLSVISVIPPTTRVSVILDRSGSMASMRDEVIGGFNGLVEEQAKEGNPLSWSMIQFDHYNGDVSLERTFTDVFTADVLKLSRDNFIPRGTTPLLDAVGAELARLGEGDDKTIVVIITDGFENASREYDLDQIRKMIEVRTDLGWQFIFLAANQDAFASRSAMGMTVGTSATFNQATVGRAYGAAGQSMSMYSMTGDQASAHTDFTTSAKADDEDAKGKHEAKKKK